MLENATKMAIRPLIPMLPVGQGRIDNTGVIAYVGAHSGLGALVDNGVGDIQVALNFDLSLGTVIVLATSETAGQYCATVRTSNTSLQILIYASATGAAADGVVDVLCLLI